MVLNVFLCFNCVSGCYKITTVFSHAQTVVLCVGCSTVLCQPTGGKARLTEGLFVFLLRLMTATTDRDFGNPIRSFHITLYDMYLINLGMTCMYCILYVDDTYIES